MPWSPCPGGANALIAWRAGAAADVYINPALRVVGLCVRFRSSGARLRPGVVETARAFAWLGEAGDSVSTQSAQSVLSCSRPM